MTNHRDSELWKAMAGMSSPAEADEVFVGMRMAPGRWQRVPSAGSALSAGPSGLCSRCNGTGAKQDYARGGEGFITGVQVSNCPACHGTGRIPTHSGELAEDEFIGPGDKRRIRMRVNPRSGLFQVQADDGHWMRPGGNPHGEPDAGWTLERIIAAIHDGDEPNEWPRARDYYLGQVKETGAEALAAMDELRARSPIDFRVGMTVEPAPSAAVAREGPKSGLTGFDSDEALINAMAYDGVVLRHPDGSTVSATVVEDDDDDEEPDDRTSDAPPVDGPGKVLEGYLDGEVGHIVGIVFDSGAAERLALKVIAALMSLVPAKKTADGVEPHVRRGLLSALLSLVPSSEVVGAMGEETKRELRLALLPSSTLATDGLIEARNRAEVERDEALARAEKAEKELLASQTANLANYRSIDGYRERAEQAERERDEASAVMAEMDRVFAMVRVHFETHSDPIYGAQPDGDES